MAFLLFGVICLISLCTRSFRTHLRHAVDSRMLYFYFFFFFFPPAVAREFFEITDPSDSMQDSCSLSQLIFPINISLCAEEQAAVQLMIWITAACRPAIPAACWEPNSLRVLRSVTHAPAPPPSPPSPVFCHHSMEDALRSNGRCLAPPSFCFSFVTSLFCRLTPSSSRLL